MKTITKNGIEELRNDFPVLTLAMMESILGGGDENKCVLNAIFTASNCGGWGYSQTEIENEALHYLTSSCGMSEEAARDQINNKGLTSDQSKGLIERMFTTAVSGSYNTDGCNIVAFATEKDSHGNTTDAHAGQLYMIDNENNTAVIKDSNGGMFVVNMSDIIFSYKIPEAPANQGCGSGDCGSGDCGSGGSGSGSGW